MKKNILYVLLGGLFLSLTACSENWEDATSKHVYGENENPYLRADAEATVTQKIQFGAGQTQIISLSDYAELFQTQLGMTVDEAIAGISSGKVVFHSINAARNTWDRTAPNKGTTGWYFDVMGNISSQADANFTVELNTSDKTIMINALENVVAGSTLSINVGFAINGTDFDQYVRILSEIVIIDVPIEVSINIPDGEYSAASIEFNDYADKIQECFGMTVAEFCEGLDGDGKGDIHMYSVNLESLKWDEESSYTANAPGYWMMKDGTVTNWGVAGYSLFAECSISDETLNIGRSATPVAGDKYTISIGFRDKTNKANLLRFVINITME